MVRFPARISVKLAVALLIPMTLLIGRADDYDFHRDQLLAQNIPEPPPPACAYCGKVGGGNPNCPHCRRGGGNGGGGNGGGGSQPTGDITRAPIFVAPMGFIGGIFTGAHWLYSDMIGRYPKTMFLDSYFQHQTFDSKDPGFDKPLSFGLFLGGLPWLVAYPAFWGVKTLGKGVVWTGGKVGNAFKAPDPTPMVRQYQRVAGIYGQMEKDADVVLAKKHAKVKEAEIACEQHLDAYIKSQPDLREIAAKDPAAARSRARKRLDAYAQAYVKRKEADARAAAAVGEFKQLINDAMAPLESQFEDTFSGITEDAAENTLGGTTSARLRVGNRRVLTSEQRVFADAHKYMGWIKNAVGLKKLYDDYSQAKGDGVTFGEWFRRQKTIEKVERTALGMMGEFGDLAEKGGDTIYAGTTLLVAGNHLAHIQKERQRLATLGRTNDFYGRAWLQRKDVLAFREEQEAKALAEKQRCEREKAKYAQKARQLRR